MEKTKKNSFFSEFKNAIDVFFGGYWFTIFFAVALLLCWFFKASPLAISVIFCSMIFILMTQKSLEGLVSVFILFPLFVYDSDYFLKLSTAVICEIIVYIVLFLMALIYHFLFLHEKSEKSIIKNKFFIPFIFAIIALFLGGVGYEGHKIIHSLVAGGFGILCFFFYYLMLKGVKKNIKKLVSFALFMFGVVAIIQVITRYIQTDDIVGLIDGKLLNVGWANSNNVAIAIATTIPLAFYLGFDNKNFAWMYYLYTFIAAFIIVTTQSRGVILATCLIFPTCFVMTMVKSRLTSKIQLIMTSVISILTIGIIFEVVDMEYIFAQFSRFGLDANGRLNDWKYFWGKFKENLAFGIGFYGYEGDMRDSFVNMAHNTGLQFLSCTGIIGTLLILPIYFQKYRLTFINFSRFKFMALMNFLFIALYGLIDVTILNSYLMIGRLGLILALEQENDEVIDKKIKLGKPIKEYDMYKNFFKRVFDIFFSLLSIICLSPLLLITAILVRVKLGKPIMFTQLRPGKNNKIFKIYKFRSMTDERDSNGNLKSDKERLTKFGVFLRKTSIDELPQLVNILKGDMSFVGPRPRLIKDMIFYNEEQNLRSKVRPGLTGYAQANGRNLNTWKKTFEYDNYYVDHISIWLDIKILFQTFIKVIKRNEVVMQDQTVEEYYYGDHLLKTGQITQEEYDEKIKIAKEMEEAAKNKKSA